MTTETTVHSKQGKTIPKINLIRVFVEEHSEVKLSTYFTEPG